MGKSLVNFGEKMENTKENTPKRKIGALGILAIFAVMIAYSTIMDYLHYAFLERHKEILGYYYDQNILILPSMILFFVCIRLFVQKSLFFKKLHIAANIAIFAFLALIFTTFSASAFASAQLTENGVRTSYAEFSTDAIASAKIGIQRQHKSYCQYIELLMVREKITFRFNTFQNDYTIADFFERYNGKLFFDGTDKPVEIEVFGLEHTESYLSGNRLVSHNAAKRLRSFANKMKNAF